MPFLFSTTTTIDFTEELRDFDIDELAEFVAISKWKGFSNQAELWPPPQVYVGRFGEFTAPDDCIGAKIRGLNDGRILLIGESRRSTEDIYAWILDWEGNLQSSFVVGDSLIFQVDAFHGGFAVMHDEEQRGPELGTRAYDLAGNLLYSDTDIFGCYATCQVGTHSFLYVPFFNSTNARVVLIQIGSDDVRQSVWPIPEELRMPGAVTTMDDTVYFWIWEKTKSTVYSWVFGSEHFEKVSEADKLIHIRGLSNGRFLCWKQDSFTILSVTE